MADVTIDAGSDVSLHKSAVRGGPFWTTHLIGYVVYLKVGDDLVYQKTTDGGASWGGAVVIKAGTVECFDCWADWQTAGDAGTKIHIIYADEDTDDIRYIYLDTSGDSVAGDDQIEACQGSGVLDIGNFFDISVSITKTRGGNIAVAFRYRDNLNAQFEAFYTSPDATTWTGKASPWEAALHDKIQIYAGNEADNQDVWAAFWDTDAGELSLKTFDDSGNSWSEQSISFNITNSIQNESTHFGGQIRLSDGHLILTAWSEYDNAASDLKVWDINGAGSITAKANVITDEAENFLVSVFVNQINDDLYITYVQGTAVGSLVKCSYKKSDDGGGSWDSETVMQADAEDDMRWVSAGAMKAAWGGKFQPVWFDIDDSDLFTNSDNGISIKVAVAVQNKSANMGAKLMAAGLI